MIILFSLLVTALLVAGAFLFVHLLPYLLIIGALVALYFIIRFIRRTGR